MAMARPVMRWLLPGVAALAALGVGLAAPAGAQKSSEVTERTRALQQKQQQLKEERARAAEARKREASVLAELEEVEKRLADKRKQVAALDLRTRKAQGEVVALQAEIARLEAQRASQQAALGRRLRALYMLHAQGGALPFLLSGDDPLERAVRIRHFAALATVDARAIREYRVSSEGLADRHAKVETRRRELGSLRAEAESERAVADQDAGRRRVLLAKVRDERAYHERTVGELSEATRRLEALLRDLEARQRRAAVKAARAGAATAAGPERRRASAASGSRRSAVASGGRPTARWSRSSALRCIPGSARRRSGTASTSRSRREPTSTPCTPGTWCTRAGSAATATWSSSITGASTTRCTVTPPRSA